AAPVVEKVLGRAGRNALRSSTRRRSAEARAASISLMRAAPVSIRALGRRLDNSSASASLSRLAWRPEARPPGERRMGEEMEGVREGGTEVVNFRPSVSLLCGLSVSLSLPLSVPRSFCLSVSVSILGRVSLATAAARAPWALTPTVAVIAGVCDDQRIRFNADSIIGFLSSDASLI